MQLNKRDKNIQKEDGIVLFPLKLGPGLVPVPGSILGREPGLVHIETACVKYQTVKNMKEGNEM